MLIVVAVLVAFGIWFGLWVLSWVQNPASPSPYTAVYMTSGDIYFGKFSRFPTPHLKEVWFVQRAAGQNNQQQFSVVPFTSAFWGPVNELYLNSKQILFWTRLRSDSQVAKGLKDPALFRNGQSGAVNQPPPQNIPAPTSSKP